MKSKHHPPPRSKPNYMYAIASVSLVLFALGFTGLLLLHARQLLNYYEEHVHLILEFNEQATPETVDSLLSKLEFAPYTLPGSIRYISREEAARLMRKDFGAEFLSMNMPNPFYDIATFNVRNGYMNPARLGAIRKEWRSIPVVNDLYYQESVLLPVTRNIQRTGTILLILGLFAILVVSALIHNTIRLALYSNRFLIKTMELVGASWGFISRPFLRRALWHGTISGCLAASGLGGVLYWVHHNVPELDLLQQKELTAACFVSIILLGTVIYLFSTWRVVYKYLRLRMDDLY